MNNCVDTGDFVFSLNAEPNSLLDRKTDDERQNEGVNQYSASSESLLAELIPAKAQESTDTGSE